MLPQNARACGAAAENPRHLDGPGFALASATTSGALAMHTSAPALTPTTLSPQSAPDPGVAASDASSFLNVLGAVTGTAKAKAAKTARVATLPAAANASGAGKTSKPATETAGNAPAGDVKSGAAAAKSGRTAVAVPGTTVALAASGAEATPNGQALPAVLLSAIAAGTAKSSESAAAAAPEGVAVEPNARLTPKDRAKLNPKRDADEASRKTADTKAAEAKSEPSERIASKPAESVAAAAPKPVASAPVAPAAGPQTDIHTADAPLPQMAPGEVRVPLSRETAQQTGVVAPMLMIRVHAKDGATKAIEIRLDPPDLGEIGVKLETGADGRLKAVLSAENAATFELLKREGGALEAALREAGVELGEDAISFTLNEESAFADKGGRQGDAYDHASRRHDETIADAIPATGWRNGLIDIRA